jgi:CHAT domain-containing protein
LSNLGSAVGKAAESFDAAFSTSLDDAKKTASSAAKMRALAETLALLDARDEAVGIETLLASTGNVSYEHRLDMLELQARIRYALGERDAAEKSALTLLKLIADPSASAVDEVFEPDPNLPIKPDLQWRAWGLLARAAHDAGKAEEAAKLYATAVTKADAIHPAAGTTSQSTADRVNLYSDAVENAFTLWEKDSSVANVERLWELLEGMKSRQWREMLATTGGEFLNALPPEERERVRSIEAEIVALDGAYRRASYIGQREEMTRVNNRMAELYAERVKVTGGKTVDAAGVPALNDVSAKLPGDWALADYYISPKLSFAIMLKSSGSEVVPLNADYDGLFGYSYWMRAVDGDKAEYGAADELHEKVFPNNTKRPNVTSCGLLPEDVADQLFQPIAAACKDLRKLIVVPHDILYVLSLEALQHKDMEGKIRYLAEDFTFAEIPSAYLLTLERTRQAPDKGDKSLLLVANPAYAPLVTEPRKLESLKLALKNDPELDKMLTARLKGIDLKKVLAGGASQEEQSKMMTALPTVWKDDILPKTMEHSPLAYNVKNDFGKKMNPLDGAQVEADIIGKLWKEKSGESPLRLVASHASESDFWKSDPGSFRYVHIASHGYDRGSIPDLQPGLALSPMLDDENDSFLQMGELATVRWNSDVVTLSACETGLGDLYVGDGMVGLSTVLLAGGTKGAILTRWRAADESAPVFMRKFYESLVEKPAVEALHDAQLTMLNEEGGDFKEPRHWAIFKYVGIPW